jgi:hypothetical protein
VLLLGNRKARTVCDPYVVAVLLADTKSTGRSFQGMAQSAIDEIPPGPKLDALTAEKVFGWKNVHKHEGALVGKKQDKAGHWRLAKVPYYSTNPVHAYSIEDRMKQVGRLDRYQKELSKITRSKNIPSEWATPDQRCRAAIKAVGRYGQVIPLSSGRKQIQK